jgi:hypothetical protein
VLAGDDNCDDLEMKVDGTITAVGVWILTGLQVQVGAI